MRTLPKSENVAGQTVHEGLDTLIDALIIKGSGKDPYNMMATRLVVVFI